MFQLLIPSGMTEPQSPPFAPLSIAQLSLETGRFQSIPLSSFGFDNTTWPLGVFWSGDSVWMSVQTGSESQATSIVIGIINFEKALFTQVASLQTFDIGPGGIGAVDYEDRFLFLVALNVSSGNAIQTFVRFCVDPPYSMVSRPFNASDLVIESLAWDQKHNVMWFVTINGDEESFAQLFKLDVFSLEATVVNSDLRRNTDPLSPVSFVQGDVLFVLLSGLFGGEYICGINTTTGRQVCSGSKGLFEPTPWSLFLS